MGAIEDPAWPDHAAGLHLSHNEHRGYYETLQEALDNETYRREDFPDQAEIDRCLAEGSVWALQWYPHSPVGFRRVCAASFARVMEVVVAMGR